MMQHGKAARDHQQGGFGNTGSTKSTLLWDTVQKLAMKNDIENAGNAGNGIDIRKHKMEILAISALVKNGASIDQSLVLHRAVANHLDASIISFLLELGGDVDCQDENGYTALHIAAASSSSLVPYLISKGANKHIAAINGKTALEIWKDSRHSDRQEDGIYWSTQTALSYHECALALMPSSQKRHLHDDWLSPRMAHRILYIAELEGDAFLDGYGNLSYIPRSLSHCMRKSRFINGYGACIRTVANMLRRGYIPTVRRVKKYSPSREVNDYLQQGGKIEYALDAVFQIAVIAFDDDNLGEDDDESFQELPETVLDDAFELASVKCINLGGGTLNERGPYGGRYQDMPDSDDDERGPYGGRYQDMPDSDDDDW
jgi:hypothetical protein